MPISGSMGAAQSPIVLNMYFRGRGSLTVRSFVSGMHMLLDTCMCVRCGGTIVGAYRTRLNAKYFGLGVDCCNSQTRFVANEDAAIVNQPQWYWQR